MMKLMFEDTIALIIKKFDDSWLDVCVTEYKKDGTWILGMNLVTSLKDVMDTAEKNKLSIIFESVLEDSNDK